MTNYIVAYFIINIVLLLMMSMKQELNVGSVVFMVLFGLPITVIVIIAYLVGTIIGIVKKAIKQTEEE